MRFIDIVSIRQYPSILEKEVRQRLQWIKPYGEFGGVGLVCRRCGITNPTLCKCWKRYQEQRIEGGKGKADVPTVFRLLILGLTLKNLSRSCVANEIWGQANSKRAETASWRVPFCRIHP